MSDNNLAINGKEVSQVYLGDTLIYQEEWCDTLIVKIKQPNDTFKFSYRLIGQDITTIETKSDACGYVVCKFSDKLSYLNYGYVDNDNKWDAVIQVPTYIPSDDLNINGTVYFTYLNLSNVDTSKVRFWTLPVSYSAIVINIDGWKIQDSYNHTDIQTFNVSTLEEIKGDFTISAEANVLFNNCSKLTPESVQNILKALQPIENEYNVVFHADIFSTISEEDKATAKEKNWNIISA